ADYVAAAEAAENLRDFAGAMLSEDYRYVRLIAKLGEFSRVEASGRWPAIDAGGAAIAAGAEDVRMRDIRRLLALAGDLPIALMDGSTVHDEKTVQAVRSFQTRHGLDPTGTIDGATLAAMAVPISTRIRQIKVNLERRRWQNRDLGEDNIYINLADANVKIVHGGRPELFVELLNAPDLALLPTFFGEITGVEVRPSAASPLALTVRSPFVERIAGEGGERTIAVSDLSALLAELVAARAPAGTATDALLSANAPATVAFETPLPLFVTFVTAWANRDGTVHFRGDGSGRDAVVARLLQLD
ncbi:peptidoglycan-binding protein, partial [Mesorhizobium marinum]|uniref:peptidoglycan-binding protein n=1 Tax=Mesorhizobium marinum TaxID=3228790 RepID=UPI003467C30F